MRRPVLAACLIAGVAFGCGHDPARELERASTGLGRAVSRGDTAAVSSATAPGVRVQTEVLLEGAEHEAWEKGLKKPQAVEPTAVIFLAPDFPVDVVQTAQGWRFAEDPTDLYAQDTPRHALRALVWASRAQRWDVVLRLAPKRYRMGLSEDDLRIAWTEGEYADVLTAARDAVAKHLADSIRADAHEATLTLAPNHVVHLEREGDQWVIVDFLGETGADGGA